jgi:hypothetical protein
LIGRVERGRRPSRGLRPRLLPRDPAGRERGGGEAARVRRADRRDHVGGNLWRRGREEGGDWGVSEGAGEGRGSEQARRGRRRARREKKQKMAGVPGRRWRLLETWGAQIDDRAPARSRERSRRGRSRRTSSTDVVFVVVLVLFLVLGRSARAPSARRARIRRGSSGDARHGAGRRAGAAILGRRRAIGRFREMRGGGGNGASTTPDAGRATGARATRWRGRRRALKGRALEPARGSRPRAPGSPGARARRRAC